MSLLYTHMLHTSRQGGVDVEIWPPTRPCKDQWKADRCSWNRPDFFAPTVQSVEMPPIKRGYGRMRKPFEIE